MASGGARVRSGPPADPNALSRDRDGKQWTSLPAAGRKGAAPAWPLSRASKRESHLWRESWKRPQAVEWERLQMQVEVALYVRRLVEAERPDAPVSVGTLVRQYADALGLSIPGLRALRWRIDGDDESSPGAPRGRRQLADVMQLKVADRGDA